MSFERFIPESGPSYEERHAASLRPPTAAELRQKEATKLQYEAAKLKQYEAFNLWQYENAVTRVRNRLGRLEAASKSAPQLRLVQNIDIHTYGVVNTGVQVVDGQPVPVLAQVRTERDLSGGEQTIGLVLAVRGAGDAPSNDDITPDNSTVQSQLNFDPAQPFSMKALRERLQFEACLEQVVLSAESQLEAA